MLQINRLLLLTCLLLIYTRTDALPVESKPLNNNPESWNLYFVPRDPLNPSAEALISSDPHVKKSKITPKSIFIAPNKNLDQTICPNGYRIDDTGKCIKTVTVNQEDILVSRLAELFADDNNSNKATNSDSDDYYDMFEEEKNSENAGPLQFSIPLMVDIEDGKKKLEYIIEEKVISMRNLPPPQKIVATPTTEKISVENVELTTTTVMPEEVSTQTENLPKTTSEIEETTTEVPTTTKTESTSTSTQTPLPSTLLPYKLNNNNVDYVPKFTRKSNRTRVKSRPRRPKPTVLTSTVATVDQVSVPSQILQAPKRTRLRSGSKRRKTTTTVSSTTTTTEVPVTHKPFYWLPKGWTIDETKKDKPVLIRFWADEPQKQLKSPYDERARSHGLRSQRMNSKKPSEEFFKEVTVPELEEILSPK